MQVCVIRFDLTKKYYYFDINNLELKKDVAVVVETVRGLELGYVSGIKTIKKQDLYSPLKPVLRIADDKDIENYKKNREDEKEIIKTCQDLADKNKLLLKVIAAEYTLDRKRLIIYFESEEKVDFRKLVKDLVNKYHTRIELRQTGTRDVAKIAGGIGPCGRLLCCNTFIDDFKGISMKMAKNQDLALTPSKISGQCGVLLCCLKYENDTYLKLRKNMPDIKEHVLFEKEKYKVIDLNIFKKEIKIEKLETEDPVIKWVSINDIKRLGKK